jgi:hypothetical protein
LPSGASLRTREELDDPSLDLVEAEMVGVEHLARLGDVDVPGRRPAPRASSISMSR